MQYIILVHKLFYNRFLLQWDHVMFCVTWRFCRVNLRRSSS